MNPTSSLSLPPRPSLAIWIVLATMFMIGSYLLTLSLAAICVVFPYLLLTQFGFGLQTLLLALGGLVIAATMLWSLIPRRNKFVAPGPKLQSARHPRLMVELERISSALNEPMPREIYLIPDVNAYVAERQSEGRSGSQRIMALGLPLLQVLTVSQFRAVLTHEFGHYYGGDTRLGPWVYKSRVVMARTLTGLGSPPELLRTLGRFAVVAIAYKMVTGALIVYWKVLLRATLLVSRRQEYRADEIACRFAGSGSLIEGLRTIRRATAVLPLYWKVEVSPVLQSGSRPPIGLGLMRFMTVPDVAKLANQNLSDELVKGKTSPYDTHPSLRNRIAAAQQLACEGPVDDGAPAVSLLDDVTVLEAELLQFLNPTVKVAEMKSADWEQIVPQVYVPSWRRFVTEYAQLLEGVTTEGLPQKVKAVREMGASIRDPQGMLLDPAQRAQRAGTLLWMALAVALVDSGWEAELNIGKITLRRGELSLNPPEILNRLIAGKLSPQAWAENCKAAGIEGMRLDPQPAAKPDPPLAKPSNTETN